jgi:putative transposase
VSVADICRKHNCSEQSFYRWKAKFGGMAVSEAKRLRELERGNGELLRVGGSEAQLIRIKGPWFCLRNLCISLGESSWDSK